MNCLGYKQSVEEGRLNNKDKVFIKIKGLYTGTMDEEASCDGEEVAELGNTERGEGGFGSTGKK